MASRPVGLTSNQIQNVCDRRNAHHTLVLSCARCLSVCSETLLSLRKQTRGEHCRWPRCSGSRAVRSQLFCGRRLLLPPRPYLVYLPLKVIENDSEDSRNLRSIEVGEFSLDRLAFSKPSWSCFNYRFGRSFICNFCFFHCHSPLLNFPNVTPIRSLEVRAA